MQIVDSVYVAFREYIELWPVANGFSNFSASKNEHFYVFFKYDREKKIGKKCFYVKDCSHFHCRSYIKKIYIIVYKCNYKSLLREMFMEIRWTITIFLWIHHKIFDKLSNTQMSCRFLLKKFCELENCIFFERTSH